MGDVRTHRLHEHDSDPTTPEVRVEPRTIFDRPEHLSTPGHPLRVKFGDQSDVHRRLQGRLTQREKLLFQFEL